MGRCSVLVAPCNAQRDWHQAVVYSEGEGQCVPMRLSSSRASSVNLRRRRRGFSLRGSSPHAWQRKIALNTAQMETKSRPKDAHRGIEARSLFSERRLQLFGWRAIATAAAIHRRSLVVYIAVLSCHCTWPAFAQSLTYCFPSVCRCVCVCVCDASSV